MDAMVTIMFYDRLIKAKHVFNDAGKSFMGTRTINVKPGLCLLTLKNGIQFLLKL